MLENVDFTPEFQFQTSRSSGAGGQNVNKVETKIELIFNVDASGLLSDIQKEKLKSKLANRIDNQGFLHVTAEVYRSQLKNKELVVEKFYAMLEKSLLDQKPRKPSRPTKASKEKRLQEKKLNSRKKLDRKRGGE
jgi:ribosome-associated protein